MVDREKVSQNSDQTFQTDFKKLVFKSIALKLIKTELDFAQNRSDWELSPLIIWQNRIFGADKFGFALPRNTVPPYFGADEGFCHPDRNTHLCSASRPLWTFAAFIMVLIASYIPHILRKVSASKTVRDGFSNLD